MLYNYFNPINLQPITLAHLSQIYCDQTLNTNPLDTESLSSMATELK